MAFEQTRERYASFGVATSLPHELIDTFWDILDNYLRDVWLLSDKLNFYIFEKEGQVAIQYLDESGEASIVFDYKYPYNPFYPQNLNIIDENGIETIILPYELNG